MFHSVITQSADREGQKDIDIYIHYTLSQIDGKKQMDLRQIDTSQIDSTEKETVDRKVKKNK